MDQEQVTFTALSEKGDSIFSRSYSLKWLNTSPALQKRLDTPQEVVDEWECYTPKPKMSTLQSKYYGFLRLWYYLLAPVFQLLLFFLIPSVVMVIKH